MRTVRDAKVDRRRILGVCLVVVGLAATACGATTEITLPPDPDSANTDAGQSDGGVDEPTPEPEPTPTREPEPTPSPDPEPTPEAITASEPPREFWIDVLEVGDCLNRPDDEAALPEIVPCDQLHEEEIYAQTRLSLGPDEPFPGEDELIAMVSDFCDPETIQFTGHPWDRVPVGTLLLYPFEHEWIDGDRGIQCAAAAPEGTQYKLGTAAGGDLVTDDVLLARAGLAADGTDFDDWILVRQQDTISTIGSLTDGQFDLPLRRPFAVERGFMFHARPAGDEGHATTTWGYSWDTTELVDLGSVLPGQEVASMAVSNGTLIFAARPTPSDDWDVFISRNDQVRPLADGAGDQQYPTLVPGQNRIVFHDNGDIWAVDFDGNNRTQLTSGPGQDWESIVSPDGTTVVFASNRTGNDELFAVSIDGGEPVNLTNHPADELWPVFSADGRYIYFSSDRLKPEDDTSTLMVMEADGSNPSWFGGPAAAQAIVVDEAVATRVLADTPTLTERYDYEAIDAEVNVLTPWTHSSGRISADLPGGWRIAELNDELGFVVARRPDHFFQYWETDGVLVTLHDDLAAEDFFALVEETPAVTDCEPFDGSDGIEQVEPNLDILAINHTCGADGAIAGVVAIYDRSSGVGLLIEGQRDNLPDEDADAILDAIATSLTWE